MRLLLIFKKALKLIQGKENKIKLDSNLYRLRIAKSGIKGVGELLSKLENSF